MDSNHLLVAVHKTLTCCDFEGAIQFQVQQGGVISAIAANQTFVLCAEWDHQSPPHIDVLDLHGNSLQVMPAPALVRCFAFNESDNRFACGFYFGAVIVFELQDAAWVQLTQLKGSASCSSIDWLNDEQICSRNEERSASIWDSSTGSLLERLSSLVGSNVTSLSFQPDDKDTLLVGGYSGYVRKCNIRDQSFVEIKPLDKAVVRLCANDTVFVTMSSGCVTAFDLLTMREMWNFEYAELITSICIFENQVFVGLQNSPVIVLDALTGEVVRQFLTVNEGIVYLALPAQGSELVFDGCV